MIVCPLCEHSQAAGAECEVCGRALASAPGGTLHVPTIEGLEPTLHAPARAEPAPLPELERTAQRAADAAPLPPLELEATRAAPVDVDAPPLPDVEHTGLGLPDDAPTALPAFPVCRYCRTPALPGERVCARCGMRLPVPAATRGEPPTAARRCGCGALVAGRACPACGARAPR